MESAALVGVEHLGEPALHVVRAREDATAFEVTLLNEAEYLEDARRLVRAMKNGAPLDARARDGEHLERAIGDVGREERARTPIGGDDDARLRIELAELGADHRDHRVDVRDGSIARGDVDLHQTANTNHARARRHAHYLAAAFVFACANLTSARAHAHGANVSRTDLVENDRGVHARFSFAAVDAKNAFDRDGHVSIDVKTDGVSCAPGPATTTPDGADGVIVEEDFACARATSSIEATLYFVTELGGTHEDVAMITAPELTHEELLRAPHRTILLELHRAKKTESPQRPFVVLGAIAAVALIALAIRSRMKRE